jgi:acyl dehydratase
VLSIQQGLLDRAIPTRGRETFAGLRWKFKAPVKIGDTVHVVARVSAKQDGDDPDWGRVTIARQVVNQTGEVIQEGETEHLVGRRQP